MPDTNNDRPSLTKTLDQRYASQKVGGAFDVKDILKGPGSSPARGTVIDALSMQATEFQAPAGFKVKADQGGVTQMKDAQSGNSSRELSRYLRGFSNVRYKR